MKRGAENQLTKDNFEEEDEGQVCQIWLFVFGNDSSPLALRNRVALGLEKQTMQY
jgi:hypothetical protein